MNKWRSETHAISNQIRRVLTGYKDIFLPMMEKIYINLDRYSKVRYNMCKDE